VAREGEGGARKVPESVYKTFLVGAINAYVYARPSEARCYSERESGDGVYDLCIEDRKSGVAYIVELKSAPPGARDLDGLARSALEQILERRYGADMAGLSVHRIGLAFCGKRFALACDFAEDA
jgi:hypothetical protein